MSKIFIAADHAGFALKAALIPYLLGLGHEVEDVGAHTLDNADDYPDFVIPCAQKVAETTGSFGIITAGSGEGEAMCANRIKGVRAAVYYGEPAKLQIDVDGTTLTVLASARAHNDANLLSIGARFLGEEEAKKACETFLTTTFSGDPRHVRRLAKF